MKKVKETILTSIILFTMALPMPAQAAHFMETKTTLNFRSKASASSLAYGKIPAGTRVNIKDTSGNFGKIAYNGQTGYLGLKYLKPVEASMALRTDGRLLNFRSGASTTSPVLGYIPKNSLLPVVDETSHWRKVLWQGQLGWVAKKLTTPVVDLARRRTTINLNHRTGPGTGYASYGKIPAGTDLFVVQELTGWAQVYYQGKLAWVGTKYAKAMAKPVRPVDAPAILKQFPNVKYPWSPQYPENGDHGLPEYDSSYENSSGKLSLTFSSDWEYNNLTAKYLDVMKAKGVRATFFLTGNYMKNNPDLVRRMQAEGHGIASHSGTHIDSVASLATSLQATYDNLKLWEQRYREIFGTNPKNYLYRPPSGEFSDRLLALADWMGYRTILYNVALRDYDVNDQLSQAETMSKLLAQTKAGSIILLHNTSTANLAVLDDYIDAMRAKGYEFADPFQ